MSFDFDMLLFQILTTVTYDEATPGLKAILSAKVPDQKSAKVINK